MCGICGIVNPSNDAQPISESLLREMNDRISHRGPDDEGYYLKGSVGLAMRRLSIIDLSGGHQPIANEDKSLWIVFNGEIYNYKELRATLTTLGHKFTTQTDTEVILHAFEEFGEDCVKYLNGMFAFVIWNERTRSLFGARDRTGIKPFLYTVLEDNTFIFGSELRSVMTHPKIERQIDLVSLNQYLSFEYVPAPRTIFRNVSKLPAGYSITVSQRGIKIKKYWDVSFSRSESRPPTSWVDYKEEVRDRLQQSVSMEMVSDVPVGVFLSGGLDSSSVAAMMVRGRGGVSNLNSFSIGFEDNSFDESKYAQLMAEKLGLRHHSVTLTSEMITGLVEKLPETLDEPLGDSSFIPTYFLSKLAREHVKVALGGDGGDELFAGYPTLQANQLVRYYEKLMPHFMRARVIPKIVDLLPVSLNNISFDFKARRFIKGRGLPLEVRHHQWLGSFTDPEKRQLLRPEMILTEVDTYDIVRDQLRECDAQDPVNKLLYCDLKFFLEGDILAKVDRASMANSLEVRVPVLNSRIFELASGIPHQFKLKGFTSKFILKKAMEGILPNEIIYRKKKGFNFPVGRLMKSSLRDLTHDLLSESRIKEDGYFEPHFVQQLLSDHMSGKGDYRKILWTLLSFQLWHSNNKIGSYKESNQESTFSKGRDFGVISGGR